MSHQRRKDINYLSLNNATDFLTSFLHSLLRVALSVVVCHRLFGKLFITIYQRDKSGIYRIIDSVVSLVYTVQCILFLFLFFSSLISFSSILMYITKYSLRNFSSIIGIPQCISSKSAFNSSGKYIVLISSIELPLQLKNIY